MMMGKLKPGIDASADYASFLVRLAISIDIMEMTVPFILKV